MGSKGSNTTTTNTSPNPAAMQSYQDLMNRASGVASTPYQAYGGEGVAGINQQQTAGINNINQNAGFAQPYIQQAAGYANQAAQPLTAAQIQQYQSPYTQQVVDATMQQFQNSNAQQQQQVLGNAASQGALGGDRVGVAQGVLAGQQQTAEAPVIAGLYNQGYTQAAGMAQQQQQNQANAAYSLGNLGVAGQNAALTGANAQVGAGSLQQGTQQALDTYLASMFQQQEAFPYAQTQWLAGIDTGVGSQMGGTSTTTGPPPNPLNTIAGLGATALGAYGGAGGFKASARGGRIAGFDGGGAVPYGATGMPFSAGVGFVPTMQLSPGHTMPGGAGGGQKQPAAAQPNISGAASGLGKLFGGGGGGSPSATAEPGGLPTQAGAGGFWSHVGDMLSGDGQARGGRIRGYDDGGVVQAGFGTGSIVPDDTFDDRFAPVNFTRPPQGLGFSDRYAPVDAATDIGTFSAGAMGPDGAYAQTSPDRFAGPEYSGEPPGGVGAPMAAPGGADDTLPPNATETIGGAPSALQAGVGAPPPSAQGGFGGLSGPSTWSPSAWNGLMAAGLGMMASRSPFLGQAIGEGGLHGLQTYAAGKKEAATEEHQAAQTKIAADRLAQDAKKAADALARESARDAEIARHNQATEGIGKMPQGYRKSDSGALEFIPGGPADPAVVKRTQEIKKPPLPGLSPEQREVQARQIATGNMSPLTGLPRTPDGLAVRNALRNDAAQIILNEHPGYTPAQVAEEMNGAEQKFKAHQIGINSEARTAGTREANLNLILRATDAAIPAALEASNKVERYGGRWVPINQIVQKGEVMASDPNLIEFGMANLQLAEHWARAMNPTGVMRESDRDKALSFLSTATSQPTYERAVHQLQKQITRERDAVRGVPPSTPVNANAPTPDPGAGASPAATSPADKQALDWANANPADPRAAAIKKRLGVQ